MAPRVGECCAGEYLRGVSGSPFVWISVFVLGYSRRCRFVKNHNVKERAKLEPVERD